MESKFMNWISANWETDNLFPPALSSQLALDMLSHYLLGENWYCTEPISKEQINTNMVHEILYKYSKQYRKEYKYYKKHKIL